MSYMDVANAENAGAFFGPALKHRALSPPLVVAQFGSLIPRYSNNTRSCAFVSQVKINTD
jgi:hypothetical protein